MHVLPPDGDVTARAKRIVVLDMSGHPGDRRSPCWHTLADLDRELAGIGIELRLAALPAAAARVAERTSSYRGLVAAGRVSPTVPAAAGSPGSGTDPAVSGG